MKYVPPTLGLRLALMMTFLMLGVPATIRLYVAVRLNAGESGNEILIGVPFDFWTIAAGVSSIAVMIGAVLAWRGRPPIMQWLYQVLMIASMGFSGLEAYIRYADGKTTQSIYNLNPAFDGFNDIFRGMIPIQLGVVLFALWYFNRQPTQAFFDQFRRKNNDVTNH